MKNFYGEMTIWFDEMEPIDISHLLASKPVFIEAKHLYPKSFCEYDHWYGYIDVKATTTIIDYFPPVGSTQEILFQYKDLDTILEGTFTLEEAGTERLGCISLKVVGVDDLEQGEKTE